MTHESTPAVFLLSLPGACAGGRAGLLVAVLVEKTLPQIAQLKLSGTRAARAARQQAEAMALRLGASS